ncbi:MAG: amidohydrolase family protein [Hyphomicrobiales bacterium]|jgi:aminocarboxymuconate-semialdehyde decarboxylase|nr:amidohydrolase family protein [Hyphomicrobiales bacterium]
MIIDAHTHTFCPPVEALVAGRFDPRVIPYKRDMSPESKAVDAEQGKLLTEPFNRIERRLADMARMRVDQQVIAPAPGQQHYWADRDLNDELSRMQNDHVAALVAQAPDRFVGLGTLPMVDPARAENEALRAAGEKGLRGFQIDTRVNERELSDPAFDRLWARLAALQTPLIIHPLGFSHGERLGPYFMVNTVGQPLEETIAFHHFVFGGVLDRHPDLKVLICHGGGYVPSYVGRLDHAWKHRPELRRLTADPPSTYLRRFWFDTCVFRADLVENLVALAGADRVLLGSDYPFDMGDLDPVGLIESCAGLDAAARRLIVADNARILFRIDG